VQSTEIVIALVFLVFGASVALVAGYVIGTTRNKQYFADSLRIEKEESEQKLMDLQMQQREALHEARDETARFRAAMERDNAERRSELQRQERRLQQKEETLEHKIEAMEQRERKIIARERTVEQAHEELETVKREQLKELERIAQLSEEQAKELLLTRIEDKVRTEAARRIRIIEEEAREEADARAREIITLAIQRCASDQVAEAVVSVVPLPNDEMKGRIIGREGRNIRALEAATGVDLIIDDTPEAVILSGFDPVRREVARLALRMSLRKHARKWIQLCARREKEQRWKPMCMVCSQSCSKSSDGFISVQVMGKTCWRTRLRFLFSRERLPTSLEQM